MWYHPASLRIVLDYRPALRHRTGVGEFAHQMAAALQRQAGGRDEVTLFSSSWKDRLAPDVIPGARTLDARVPVSVLNVAWHRLGWPPVESLGADVDVAWSLHPLLMPARRAAQVVTVHDLFFLENPMATAREIRRDYASLALAHTQRADAVITISEYTRHQVIEKLKVPPERITVCVPGAPAWTSRSAPPDGGPILHIGTIEPRKNVGAIVRGYERLRKVRAGAPPLLFAGKVAEPVASADAAVKFLGYVSEDERLRLLRDASMLVMASLDEGFGIPALEAMTMGVPVIAAARGSLPEVLGDAGLLVEVDKPDVLAAAITRLLDDAVLRRDLVTRGLARARQFNWDASAARLREAFAIAIERRKARRR